MAVTLHVVRDHCLAPERVDRAVGDGGRYGRMFDLPAFQPDETLLHALGAAGGFCDGGDCEDDAQVEAGWPFFGQYIAHDLTADRSPLRSHVDLDALRNMRSPRANLEALYGGGPAGSPYLYQRDDPAKLLENNGDLPRNHEGIALIGDPRNDVHVFMSQMHVAFIRAHNLLVVRLREDGVAENGLFDEARRALSWHYQWLIVNDFLPSLVGWELVEELVASGGRYYPPNGRPFILSSSPTLRIATATRRSASSTSCNRAGRSTRCSPTSSASVRSATAGSTGRSSSTSRPDSGTAREADRRTTAALADRAAASDHGRTGRPRLPLAGRTRPRARSRHRASLR
jgi:hypothetical protein